jgi:hypothetical protein
VSRDIVEDVCRDFDLAAGAPLAENRLPAGGNGTGPVAKAGLEPVTVPDSPPAAAGETGRRTLFEHFSVRRRFSLF